VVKRLLEPLIDSRSFLEVGCGAGALGMTLSQRYDYVGYEPDETSFQVAASRMERAGGSGRVVNSKLPAQPAQHFDVLGAFEVLEHIRDDGSALSTWVRWLRPGGYVVISVPAHPTRYGPADEYVGHFRRYTRETVAALLEIAGLTDAEVFGYGFPLGYVLEFGRNQMLGRRMRSAPASQVERTAGSGRRLQPKDWLAPVIWATALPFGYLQRPFVHGNMCTGFVARARLPAGSRSGT
jgi:SAM-dependent methyltransferase